MVFALTATHEEEELEFSETSESEDSDEMTSDEEITKTPALKSSQTNEVSSQRPSEEHFTQYVVYVYYTLPYRSVAIQSILVSKCILYSHMNMYNSSTCSRMRCIHLSEYEYMNMYNIQSSKHVFAL